MDKIDRPENCRLLESIYVDCAEIQAALKVEGSRESNAQYHEDIERDIVTLENLKRITLAVKHDIAKERIGESVELILLITANDFKNKLNMIPEKKAVIKDMIEKIKVVHKNVRQFMQN